MIARQVSQPTMVAGNEQKATSWQQRFLHVLPRIRAHAQRRFRYLAPEAREDAIAEIIANSLVAYARLVAVGKEDRASATSLARYAEAHYLAGRRVGSRLNVRDATSDYCRQEKGVSVERWGDWQALAVEDRRVTPAEFAARWLAVADPLT